MPKLSIDTTLNYSPNFNITKRKVKNIKFIIFHYTGMKKEIDAINLLTDQKSKVSCHYFIKKNGEILTLVPDLYISWHAGVSSWKNFNSINKNSIGIEISNPGHDFEYKKFPTKQINSILKLTTFLIKKYKIKSNFILGHSDIAPDRKKDPGEKFPWNKLAKKNFCKFHNLNEKKINMYRNLEIKDKEKKIFFSNLIHIGYSRMFTTKHYRINLVEAFQRKYRQKLINGKIDQECLLISKNLKRL